MKVIINAITNFINNSIYKWRETMNYKVYKITNNINKKIYIGVTGDTIDNRLMGHSVAKSYMGNSIRKYGKENFTIEEIFLFNCKDEAYSKEREIVDEDFLKRKDVYNQKLGGFGGWEYINENNLAYKFSKEDNEKASKTNRNMVVVKDENGNHYRVTSEKYKKGKYVHNTSNKVSAINAKGETLQVTEDEFKKGSYKGICSGKVTVIEKSSGNKIRLTSVEYHKNKGYYIFQSANKGESNGKSLHIRIFNDKDELMGETIGDFIGYCKRNSIPSYPLIESYQNNGKKVKSINARKKAIQEINGWYAIKIERVKNAL